MIRKNSSFYNQNLLSLAILIKKLKVFIFMVFKLNSSFFQNIYHCNISLGRGFPTIPNLLNSFKSSKSYNGSKT